MTLEDDPRPDQGVASPWMGQATAGRNGVMVAPRVASGRNGYRSYEIHQRQRVQQTTEKISGRQLISADFARDPYPALAILREHYPAYRDWISNCYWVTRYDDVTSVFVDDANFESRSKRWFYGIDDLGRDLRDELPVLVAQSRRIDAHAEPLAQEIVASLVEGGQADLAIDFAARFPLELLARVLDLPPGDFDAFAVRYWKMQQGAGWQPAAQAEGKQAIHELIEYFRPLMSARRVAPGDDLISAVAGLELSGGPATAEDLVVTLLEADHETLHGALANMWFLLLTHPEQLDRVRRNPRLLNSAYLETLRHSPPVLSARRFARHEVERFGQLLPEGAAVVCSAAAANRDPRVFADPDRFDIGRGDLCRREPRGQYRADGLPSGVALGLGKPSRHPAVPEDRPRSLYAITRSIAVSASTALLSALPNLRLAVGAAPTLKSRGLGEMRTCWSLPVEFDRP